MSRTPFSSPAGCGLRAAGCGLRARVSATGLRSAHPAIKLGEPNTSAPTGDVTAVHRFGAKSGRSI
ncbi:hypothetical protein CP981_01355 [Streptomyces platensis]|uniref:Uncharacterized protein n=1 Tax=Streptomyces platensis TaxID=58346 RepID=A0AAE6NCU4_STRPT|nr:hypothetical protein CP981_01355 [Streptomyces platensis]